MARFARVSTIAFAGVEAGANRLERLHDRMAQDLELAARAKPDLVTFPEFVNATGISIEQAVAEAETIPGPTTDRMAELAVKHSTYVVVPIPERDGDRVYNTAAFIDRDGQIIGKYHKYQPTIGEMEAGITPGSDAPAFDTDFGKVGAAICFDMKFNEVGQHLADSGARLVVFPSMFIGGDRMLHWARDYGFYLLSCCPARSYLVDVAGRYLGETGWEINQVSAGLLPPIYSGVINMDRMLFHLDRNQNFFPDMLAKYGAGIEIEVHYPEAHFTLASVMEDVTVEDLVREYDLEPWIAYLKRARGEREKYLA